MSRLVNRKPENLYKDFHWGVPATKKIDWRDPDYPDTLIEMGRLLELHIKRSPKAAKEVINIAQPYIEKSHLAFDPAHSRQRLYILTPQAVRRAVKSKFWHPSRRTYDLNEVAKLVGGAHGKKADYPHVRVQPIGLLTHVTYLTNKGSFEKKEKPDGLSAYVHEHSEDSHGPYPVLCVDVSGRLWYAGGVYYVIRGGIAD